MRKLIQQPFYWLLAALPAAVGMELFQAGALWIFVFSGLAIVPLAGLMGRATENLAQALGPAIGGLLNATFGNAAELIIALLVLWRGPAMYPLVKATITGSIIGNVLLVLGMSILAGGFFYRRQKLNRAATSMGATLLALASIGLIVPTLYYHLFQLGAGQNAGELRAVEQLSEEIACVLAVTYGLSLVFSLGTHQELFGRPQTVVAASNKSHEPDWSRTTSLVVLLVATAGVAWMSHLLVGTVEHAGQALSMNQVFLGVIVVAVVGNAAEHSTAVLMATKDKMELAAHIAIGSSIQVALFVAPVLVFASMLMGHARSLDLHFTPLEMIAVVLAVGVLALICQDGETHWMEGALLLAVYIILALAFYHLPSVT